MAIIKCKMCGGNLNLVEGASTAECEWCGSVQTIPNLDDEKKLIQFERAERLRKQCEFDKAAGIYEAIVADFPEEAEAYWGLVLCKYGIEYVDDPATGKKIPTCHRSSFESIMEDSDFEQALENADSAARRVYRDEAKAIEEIRKGIISVSSNEQPYDIFICYKETAENGDRTLDSVLAQDVYDALTERGYRVFFSRITLEDKLGVEYEPYIFAALNSSKIMLVFGTDYEYYNAVWVKNEWSRFLKLMAKDKEKHLIPCYKGIDAYDMPKEFAKLQAQDLGKVGAMQDLLRGIEKILPKQKESVPETVVVRQQVAANPTVESYLERVFMFLEDGDWDSADQYCEKVLDIDPKNARAYLGKLLAELKVESLEALKQYAESFGDNPNYQKTCRFGDEKLKATLSDYQKQADVNQKAATHTLDLTKGSVTKKLLSFAMPILLSTVLQHLYTIADRVVVGNFALDGATSLAAVGATNSATNLLLNLFVGISLGANIVCANLRGANNGDKLRKCMHSAVVLSVFCGVALMFIGLALAESILTMMDTPADVLPMATTYMRIFFMGMPASLVYNFGAAILRSHGDSKRTMYILGVTGLVNVLLNLVLVIGFHLDVAGVAIATITAQYLSALAVLWILFSKKQEYKLRLKELRLHKELVGKMVAIGVPCGINGILQCLSNVILQSSVNSFGKYVIAGNTAATDINNFAYLINGAFSSACVSFAGQCCGARQYKRLDKLVVRSAAWNTVFVVLIATVTTIFPRQLLSIFNADPAVVEAGVFKLILLSWTCIFYGISETMVGCIRGMGKSVSPTVLNILCLCGVRLAWVLFVFPHCPHDPRYLYLCFPISWILAAIIQAGNFIYCRKRLK